jgi:hypothetical protein
MADGVFADRWVEPAAAVSLRGCANAAALSLAGFVPGVPAPWQPFDLAVSVNGRQLDPVRIARAGDFEATLRLPEPVRRLDSHDIRLKASRSFVPAELGTSPDRRRLSFRLSRIELSRSPGDRR